MAKVLVVDDDKSIIELMRVLLQKDGHTVSIATDGKAGLLKAQQEKPDLIILDVMMPEMDGFSVSGALFKNPDMRNTPVMVLTAKGNSRDIFELVPNVRMHMKKPFDPSELLASVRKLLAATRPTA